jgi:integrase
VTATPFAVLAAKELLGKATERDRVLTDTELASVWRATDGLPYPYDPVVRLLQLTGLRLREAAELSWSENLDKAIITIPASRMKGKVTHVLPIAPMALAILESLPGSSGSVFSTTGGQKPIAGFSKMKGKVDAAMLEPVAHWTFHDLRRSFRTGLAMLGTPEIVSELCVAHAQKSLHRTSDRHAYLPEKSQALTRWENHLRSICEPFANVIEFTSRK